MTTSTPTTSACRNEALKSPVLAAFLRLPRTLSQCIAAEGHLRAADASAFDSAQRACEAADETLSSELRKILALPEACPSDRSMRRLAFLLRSVLSIENNGDRRYLAASLLHDAQLFETWGAQPMHPVMPRIERHCLGQIARLVELRAAGTAGHAPEASSPGLAA